MRSASKENIGYLLAPPTLDGCPESLVSPAEHPDYGFIIKAISTSHFTQLGRSNVTCDTSATTCRTGDGVL